MIAFSEKLWKQFQEALGLKESPLGIYYTKDKPDGVTAKEGVHACMIGLLQNARKKGETVFFDKDHFGCPGGAYFMGFFESPRPKLEYFLSCGIPGEMEGERYIKTPELAKRFIMAGYPGAPGSLLCLQTYSSVPRRRKTRSGCLFRHTRYPLRTIHPDELFLETIEGVIARLVPAAAPF